MSRRVDLNADVGEGASCEADLLKIVTSANVACGGHFGDSQTMSSTVARAIWSGVRIGAHPSYPDLENFGRKSIDISSTDLLKSISEQIDALKLVAENQGTQIAYIKPHGALYNDAVDRKEIASVVAEACHLFSLPAMTMPGGALYECEAKLIREGFADRAYTAESRLMSRAAAGSVISDAEAAGAQAVRLAETVDSICIHSDTPNAVQIARAVKTSLEADGYQVSAGLP